jgi:hypothetical protein
VASLLLSAGSLFAAAPSPRFEGMDLPESPQQRKAWTPPETKLPETFVTATVALFRAGLADPRGCAYRVIEVGVGDCWGHSGVVTTHGWVLPAPDAKKQRFAVCWNGLVYPVVSVGKAADLKADIAALVKEDEAMRARHAREQPTWPFNRLEHAWSEGHSVSHQSLLPLKASLLLRLGEEELARRVWTAWTAGMQPNTNNNDRDLKDPFILLATDWVWAAFDRAVCAHMRGDDRLALVSARSVAVRRDTVEKLAEERGFQRPNSWRKLAEGEKVPYLTFLEPLPALLADQERRAKQTAKPRPAARAASKRIAGLIDDLEEVSSRQWAQPGGVSLNFDGRVAALIREGDAAVEPLLHCLETDRRLTRSVHFHRDFFRHRSILGVHEAAYTALTGILETSVFGPASTGDDLTAHGMEGRKKVAAQMRAYWRKFKGVTPAERWFRILADDDAGAEQWLQAAQNIVRRGDSQLHLADNGSVKVPKDDPGDATKPRGVTLRAKKNPSVNDLLRKRMRQLATGEDDVWDRNLDRANTLAQVLAEWDGASNLEEFAWLNRTQRARLDLDKPTDRGHLLKSISSWCPRRVRLGDRKALDEYAEWIVAVRPEKCGSNMRDVLQPLWQYADQPAMVRAADTLFAAGSPWVPLLQKPFGLYSRDLLTSPLLSLSAYRKAVLAGLADRSPAGTITPHEGGSASIECALGWSTGTGYWKSDPLVPKLNTKAAFRSCDMYAWSLSAIPGMPACQLYWPQAKRDEAVAACAAFLRRHGEHLQPNTEGVVLAAFSKTRLTFPLLGRPATKTDVESGRAIFALAEQGEGRVVKLPRRPLPARWTTLKAYPFEQQSWDPQTKKRTTTLKYDRDGSVWQAEEVLREGKWQRFYGFVSRHSLAQAPAGEIEFPGGPRWSALSRGLECRLTSRVAKTAIVAGAPLVVTVELRNRSGLDQSVPTQWYSKDGLALRPGVRVQLWHSSGEVEKSTQKPRWTEVSARKIGHLKPDKETRTLAPTEAFTAFEMDLHDLFVVTRPGAYRLLVTFTSKDGGLADGSSLEETFNLASESKPGEPGNK